MKPRTVTRTGFNDVRLMDIKDLKEYLSVGGNTAMKIAEMAKARYKIGKRVLYDKKKIDKYLDTMKFTSA